MLDSNTLASFALVISIVSFWLSYKTFRQNSRMASAEKRTEALSALRKTSMQLSDLLEKAQWADSSKVKKSAESLFGKIASDINNELKKVVKGGGAHDPVLLEHLKAYAIDVGELVSNIGPKLMDTLENTKLATTEQIEQVNVALQEAIESVNVLIATMRSTQVPSYYAATFENRRTSIEMVIGELLTEVTIVINDILARDEIYSHWAARCKDIVSKFTDRRTYPKFCV